MQKLENDNAADAVLKNSRLKCEYLYYFKCIYYTSAPVC